jgi:hypothetical protein
MDSTLPPLCARPVLPPQAPVPPGYAFRDVQLEMSLKPFWDNTAATRNAICEELFIQWLPLCRHADSISIQLWVGDGSEILEYEGDLDRSFEWGRYQGSACHHNVSREDPDPASDTGDPDHDAIGLNARVRDPERRSVHQRPYLYRPEPAVFTFRWLRDLIAALKDTGSRLTGKPVRVGTTFDIGPEFAVSRFKYEWHREICGGGAIFGGIFIRCDALLDADSRAYAGWPLGIPARTPIGKFLGRQCRHFFADCPFDFLWLSNGFGFALEPWALTGAIFDGEKFKADAALTTSRQVLKFWEDFRSEAPDLPLRTRGTNLGTGIDLGSDASPLREIYTRINGVEPPVNSPWAALDADVGLELAGWMAHIAETPGRGYRYRYYLHDPWWCNSPWLDRYQRQPFDIYLPLGVSRLHADGSVEPPCDIALLTVDDSHGRLPVVVPTEVIPHVLHAREFLPDAPGPVVWIYPFEEYHDLVIGGAPDPALPFFGDWFVRGLIAHGVPVNTVASTSQALPLLAKNPAALLGSILIAPVLPDHQGVTAPLLRHAAAGGRVLFYGPLADAPSLRALIGAGLDDALDGDFELPAGVMPPGMGQVLRHLSMLSAGGWRETPPATINEPGVEAVAARQNGKVRAASIWKSLPSGGCVGWVRGSLATAEFDPAKPRPIKGPRLAALDPRVFATAEALARAGLARMGLRIAFDQAAPRDQTALLTVHRHRNAFVFSGYQPDAAVPMLLGLPAGAPLFPALRNRVQGAETIYVGPNSWHHVCRAFVEENGASSVLCRILPAIQFGYTERLLISGLNDATVRFFPAPGSESRLEILRAPLFPYFKGDFVKTEIVRSPEGPQVVVTGVTGELLFSW